MPTPCLVLRISGLIWEDNVPLSEEELKALEQMERALAEEDPKFASTLRGTTLRRTARRRAIVAGVCFVAGVGVLMGGAVARITPVGILGFVIMLASATIGLTLIRGQRAVSGSDAGRAAHPAGRGRPGRSRQARSSGSFMERMEQRWRRRRDNGA